jgi:hypothetical protein
MPDTNKFCNVSLFRGCNVKQFAGRDYFIKPSFASVALGSASSNCNNMAFS